MNSSPKIQLFTYHYNRINFSQNMYDSPGFIFLSFKSVLLLFICKILIFFIICSLFQKQMISQQKLIQKMKNKKKTIESAIFTKETKLDPKSSFLIKKKSPQKLKHKQTLLEKAQILSSLNSSNSTLHQNKNSNLFYGKKYRQQQHAGKKVGDSNQSSTHCSINNRTYKQKSFQNKKNPISKSYKMAKNQDYCHNQMQQEQEMIIQLNKQQVMQLINSYAIQIQRQWRRYWLRKCLKFIIYKQKELKQYQLLNDYYERKRKVEQNNKPSSENSYNCQSSVRGSFQSFENEQKRHNLPKLGHAKRQNLQKSEGSSSKKHQSSSSISVNQTENFPTDGFYNNRKYASLTSFNSNKIVSSNQIEQISKQIYDRTSSLGQNIEKQLRQTLSVEKVDIGLNCSSNDSLLEHRHYSTPINYLKKHGDGMDKKSSQKKSNIKLEPKVYECTVIEQKPKTQNDDSLIMKQKLNQSNRHLIDRFQIQQIPIPSKKQIGSEESINKYDTKFPQSKIIPKDPFGMTKILKKYKKTIKNQTHKNISEISRKYQEKQITERTYKNLVKQTNEQFSSQIKSLEIKEGSFRNSWNQIYVLFKDYVKQNSFQTGEQQLDKQFQFNYLEMPDQASISFDKWDFESSAKKSISHLQSFQEFAKQLNERNPHKLKGFYSENKRPFTNHKTIQLVLQQLDKQQNDNDAFVQSKINHINQAKNSQPSQLIAKDGRQILQEFRRKQRSTYFQKNDNFLIESVAQKLTAKEIKSPTALSKTFLTRMSQRPASLQRKIISDEKIQFEQKDYTGKLEHAQFHQYVRQKEFDFPEMKSPVHSECDQIQTLQPFPSKSLQIQQGPIMIQTQQSQEDSQVQIKVTSIKVEQSKAQIQTSLNNEQSAKRSFINQSLQSQNRQVSLNELLNRSNVLQRQKTQTDISIQLTDHKIKGHEQQSPPYSFEIINEIATAYYQLKVVKEFPQISKQILQIIKQINKQKQLRKQLQLNQLKKYPTTIDPSIDAINTWLLEISHHLIDHHNSQIKYNLVNIKQLTKLEMIQISKDSQRADSFFNTHPYQTVSEKIFKEFQFFYLKNVANTLEIQQFHQRTFQHLLYAFHRALIDCMNITLLDELSIGKNWVVLPWFNTFHPRKLQVFEHTKQCLERAINRVSSWGEYCMFQFVQNTQINQYEWKQYQQEKLKLIVLEEVFEYPIQNEFYTTNLILKICEELFEDEIDLAGQQISSISQK